MSSEPVPSWEKFINWWHSRDVDYDIGQIKEKFSAHPIFSQAMAMNRTVTAVIDIQEMKYIYWSGNGVNMSGWNDQDFIDGGVAFSYTKFHTDDLFGMAEFAQLIYAYFKQLPEIEKKNYRSFWDFRFLKKDGDYVRVLQQDNVLTHDVEGNIAVMMLFLSEISGLKSEKKMHLRLTNGEENKLYEYHVELRKLSQLICPSQREIEIFLLINQGYDRPQIASKLGISLLTVKTHCQNVFEKINTNDTLESVMLLKFFGFL